MIGTLLATGIVVVGIGSALSFLSRRSCRASAPRRSASRWARRPASGCSHPGRSWRLVHERARTAGRHRPAERLLPLRARARRGARARLRLALPRARHAGPRDRRAHRRVPALAGVVLCARDPLTFLALLGADDARARGDHPRRHGRRSLPGSTVFIYVAITHLGGAGTWIAILLLAARGSDRRLDRAHARARASQVGDRARSDRRLRDEGGLMPLHVWLPRAHPIAPAPISALMSGVMIKVAALRPGPRARRLARRAARRGSARRARPRRRSRRSAASSYALFQHDLKRLLAYSTRSRTSGSSCSGSAPACCLRAARRRRVGRVRARRRALLHTLNHAVFKALLFLGAGAFERATGRSSSTASAGCCAGCRGRGGAFLVGCARDRRAAAAERLRVGVADAPGAPPRAGVRRRLATGARGRARPRRARGDRGARRALLREGGRARAARARRDGAASRTPSRRRRRCAARSSRSPAPASCSGSSPGLLFALARRPRALAATDDAPTTPGLDLPGTGALPTVGDRARARRRTRGAALARAREPPRRAEPDLGLRAARRAASSLWTSAGFSKPLRLVLEAVLRPQREIETTTRGGVVQEVTLRGPRPAPDRRRTSIAPSRRARSSRRPGRGACRAVGSARTSRYLIALVVVLLVAVRIGAIG